MFLFYWFVPVFVFVFVRSDQMSFVRSDLFTDFDYIFII